MASDPRTRWEGSPNGDRDPGPAAPAPDLVTLGEALVQLNATEPGPLATARTFHQRIGGSELNTAVGAARLGLRTGWIGRIGDDELGSAVLRAARADRVDTSQVQRDAEAPTGLFLVQRGYPWAGASSSVYYRTGSAGSRLAASAIDERYVRGARALHFSGVSLAASPTLRDACWTAAGYARDAGSLVSFDVNDRRKLWGLDEAREQVTEALRRADVAFCSLDDARALFSVEEPERALDLLREHGPRYSVVTCGGDGAVFDLDGRLLRARAVAVDPIDPTGAGDALAATVLAGLLDGWDPRTLADSACLVGSIVCASIGDHEGVPTRAQLSAYAAERWVSR